jgi:hypothetical protein
VNLNLDRRAQQALAADGAIAFLSDILVPSSLNSFARRS